jgi:neutral trehalase
MKPDFDSKESKKAEQEEFDKMFHERGHRVAKSLFDAAEGIFRYAEKKDDSNVYYETIDEGAPIRIYKESPSVPAIREIYERAWGKVKEAIELTGKDGANLYMSPEEMKTTLAMLQKKTNDT